MFGLVNLKLAISFLLSSEIRVVEYFYCVYHDIASLYDITNPVWPQRLIIYAALDQIL